MASPRRIVAALAGLLTAFVLVMLLTALTPDPELNDGFGRSVFERFAFEDQGLTFTEGSRVELVNRGAVPATFIVQAPDGTNSTVALESGATTNLTLDQQGTYRVTGVEWFWADQAWEVRSANPFVRYLENLF